MTKMNIQEKLGFLYITLAHVGVGMVLAVVFLVSAGPLIPFLFGVLLTMILALDYFILREGLDVIFRKKEAKT